MGVNLSYFYLIKNILIRTIAFFVINFIQKLIKLFPLTTKPSQITLECNQIKENCQVQFNPLANTLKCSRQLLNQWHCSQEELVEGKGVGKNQAKRNEERSIMKKMKGDGARERKEKHLMIITATISNCLAAIITK